ncbi:biopolymer transporter ExbB [Shimia thalassica]|uniref:biopolymer transporter ExbB n=1 Tax=Shimia thalassica TaxID=1715693 RepID=UPI001C087E9E|nr:biopolymer transporter ExbB [Shimia thalassica]MBU2942781.1 biopolymer transporter ExbB [Shimia thalassica]MDO6480142.1 biopolymer transporter ExbB [Shimia thalassica]MDO6502451.1 biopolymer transporter ExbB [Shimia thalassica]MDO6799637.1 biopolymer transporter ExbB [Shimia thalassica]MDP2495499.1 biopolymer transporter ExbB [Shimia thalassica]
MDQPDRKVEPHFSQPVRQIMLMLIVLGLTAALGYFALPRVMPVFEANPYLNGFILFVFLIGVAACFGQVLSLISSVRWIESFAMGDAENDAVVAPSLLAPLATLLRSRGAHSQISATSTRSILDSVATRIDEAREITRYLVNMLIFLGLLGTFYGLATTVPAVVDTIRSLAPQEGEAGVEVFSRLMSGLEAQLGGMGVAFASSLLGLAGSLIVGLLELFAGHGQNRFYRELEEWLSSITRVGFSAGDGDGGADHGALTGVMDHLGRQIDVLGELFVQAEANRHALEEQVSSLVDSVRRMADGMEANAPTSQALFRAAEGQEELIHLLRNRQENEGLDAESRMRLRSIDVQMLRILEEVSAGRQESMGQLRNDLAALARVLRDSRGDTGPAEQATPPVGDA